MGLCITQTHTKCQRKFGGRPCAIYASVQSKHTHPPPPQANPWASDNFRKLYYYKLSNQPPGCALQENAPRWPGEGMGTLVFD